MAAAERNYRVASNEDWSPDLAANKNLGAAVATVTMKNADGDVAYSGNAPIVTGSTTSSISPEILAADQLSVGIYEWDMLVVDYPAVGESHQWFYGTYTVYQGQS